MWKDISRILGYVSFVSMYLTGGVTIVLVASFGPLIAQGLQAVLAVNPEPTLVRMPYPWVPSLVAITLPWPILFSGRPRWATAATIPMLLAPLLHLAELYRRSA